MHAALFETLKLLAHEAGPWNDMWMAWICWQCGNGSFPCLPSLVPVQNPLVPTTPTMLSELRLNVKWQLVTFRHFFCHLSTDKIWLQAHAKVHGPALRRKSCGLAECCLGWYQIIKLQTMDSGQHVLVLPQHETPTCSGGAWSSLWNMISDLLRGSPQELNRSENAAGKVLLPIERLSCSIWIHWAT